MAQLFGTSGRNAAEESRKRTKRLLVVAFCSIGALALFAGYAIGAVFPIRRLSLGQAIIVDAFLLCVTILTANWASRRIDAIERERHAWRKGAIGEAAVEESLSHLPDDFVVVNDVSKRLGNIDHVVIGPTGIYVLDTKNWSGTIAADGEGEVLLNGKALPKPPIKSLLSSVMDFQGKLKALAEEDYFVRGVMVFPIAYVEARYGTTRQIHCLRTERLLDYIQSQTFSRKLSSQTVEKLKRATLQLARMDERFGTDS
jgi:hypothetical protein